MPVIRRAEPKDLAEIAGIQNACPQAAQWPVQDYLAYDLWVAVDHRVAGFLCARPLAPGEWEVLNLAVAPESRRRGIARALLKNLIATVSGTVFLEVRASNEAALQFYKSMNFEVVSTRNNYYQNPPESAIVMKFHSC